MAIISIPTSIGGVTIPGNVINGPLGSLFGNPFASNILHYPRDLQSSTRGHVVYFQVYDVDPIGLKEISNLSISSALNSLQNTAENIYDKSTDGNYWSSVAGSVSDGLNSLVGAAKSLPNAKLGEALNSTGISFQPRTEQNAKAHIYLYMPETVNLQYDMMYDTTDLVKVGGKMLSSLLPKADTLEKTKKLGDAVTSIINAGVNSGAASLLTQKAGYAVNPQLQLLFQGIGFRTHQMSFTFTPYSKQENDMVQRIIKTFRLHSAPRIVRGAGGMFFVPPSKFKIKFMFNSVENKNLYRLADCVITNVDVNHAPNGYSTHTDGSPVQTTLTLQLKEITLVDREMIEKEGY